MEENKELVSLVKQTPQILSTIYTDLAQPSVRRVGVALETVFEFRTSLLLPVKLLNEKFRLNFEKRLNDYKKKLDEIPNEELIDVNPQIGTPIIEKLSYTTNDEIADLFTNLLTKASSTKLLNLAHPSFIQLIERLSVDEARIIKSLITEEIIPCVTFRAHMKENKGFHEIIKNATLLSHKVELIFPKNVSTYLDNLVSMGVLDISHGLHKMDEDIYNPIFEVYGYEQMSQQLVEIGAYERFEKKKSYYRITDFGKTFIKACNPTTN